MRVFRAMFISALCASAASCATLIGELEPFEYLGPSSEGGAVADGSHAPELSPDAKNDVPPGAEGDANDGGNGDSGDSGKIDSGDSGDAGCVALHFGTLNDGVAIPDSPALSFGAAGTMEAWFYAETVQTDSGMQPNLFTKVVTAAEDKHLFFFPTLKPIGFLFPSVDLIGATPVPKNQWVHIAHSWSGFSQALYINGVTAADAGAPTPANSNGAAHIGSLNRGGTIVPPLYGFISEVRISNIPRYTANFTPAPHLANDINTKAFWKLDEEVGMQAKDDTITANHGVISGATWQPAPCR